MSALRASDRAEESEALARVTGAAENLRRDLSVCDERLADLREQHEKLTPAAARIDEIVVELTRQVDEALVKQERFRDSIRECETRIDIKEKEQTRIKAELDAAVSEITRIEVAQRDRRVVRKGPDPSTNGRTSVAHNEIIEAIRKFRQFTPNDVASALKMSPKAASARIADLMNEGIVADTGMKFAGKKIYEFTGAEEEKREHEAESLILVRDFAVKSKEPFAPQAVEDATDVGGDELITSLQTLLQKGVIEYVGFNDLELYQYVKPTDPGDAAKRDMERRRTTSARERSAPVSGTGAKEAISNPEVRTLVRAIERLGGTVTHAANGHYEVTHPNNPGKRVLIAGTPKGARTVRNDTSRVRRELNLQELSI